jgi:hypothetical protein
MSRMEPSRTKLKSYLNVPIQSVMKKSRQMPGFFHVFSFHVNTVSSLRTHSARFQGGPTCMHR